MFRSRPAPPDDTSEPLPPRVAAARDAAIHALAPKLAQARDAVAPPLASARDRIAPRVETALDTTRQVASDRMLPAAEVARERLAPVVNRAADAFLDTVLPAVTAATEAYDRSQAVEEIRRRGEAAVATIRTEGPDFARRRWPLILGLVTAGAAVGAVVGIVTRKRTPEPVWTPPAPPAGIATPVAEPIEESEETGVEPVDLIDAVDVVPVDVDPLEAEATRSEQ
jgi:hypothetical protein